MFQPPVPPDDHDGFLEQENKGNFEDDPPVPPDDHFTEQESRENFEDLTGNIENLEKEITEEKMKTEDDDEDTAEFETFVDEDDDDDTYLGK